MNFHDILGIALENICQFYMIHTLIYRIIVEI
jgi:hypothetical protein